MCTPKPFSDQFLNQFSSIFWLCDSQLQTHLWIFVGGAAFPKGCNCVNSHSSRNHQANTSFKVIPESMKVMCLMAFIGKFSTLSCIQFLSICITYYFNATVCGSCLKATINVNMFKNLMSRLLMIWVSVSINPTTEQYNIVLVLM